MPSSYSDALRALDDFTDDDSGDTECLSVCNALLQAARKYRPESHADPFWRQEVTESARTLFGERPAIFLMVMAAAMAPRNPQATVVPADIDVFDQNIPLVARVQLARSKAGQHKWWLHHFHATKSECDLLWLTSSFLLWASGKTVNETIEDIQSIFDAMSAVD